PLHVVERGLGPLLGYRRVGELEHEPPPVFIKRKVRRDSVRMYECRKVMKGIFPIEIAIGEEPVIGIRSALELKAEYVPDRAVRPVAPGNIRAPDSLLRSV